MKYSVPLTALSAVVAIGVVGLGLSLVTLVRFTRTRLLVAGTSAGLGVAGRHYTGMAAVRVTNAPTMDASQGTAVFDLVFPVFVTSALVVAALLWMLFTADDDMVGEAV